MADSHHLGPPPRVSGLEKVDHVELLEESGESDDVSDLCLIGKVITQKTLNKQAVCNILQTAWRPRATLNMSPWSKNVFLFPFSDPEDRRKVLFKAPWLVMGHLLVVQPLEAGKSGSELEFQWCPFWVQAHGLSVAKLTRQNGEIIGQRISKLIGVEAMHDGLFHERSFLRMRVNVDISKPLSRGFFLHQNTSQSSNVKELWISYKFEKLSDFCYDCGQIGHDNTVCKFISRELGRRSGYGPNLRAK
ncbi:hypothetical protein LOK49_LG05G00103 [Camellia lanceoleosa]|uniref:Uncharacterized protein n=1 Tax=Camellia lanceoleosa TaxID=1840588 RepID=A0ACC0HPC3_9ERIC|nr:hypothetical protein LOK49_LG05G00103 [Camellia lanceoleosa]